ncbi:MAG TPA: twin-arginine translocase subunit TatC [Sandaracinaceae bacterium]
MAEPERVEPDRPEDDVEMTFFEHIAELRTRLIRCLIAIVPGTVLGWYYRDALLELLVQPYMRATAELDLERRLSFIDPADAFFYKMFIAIIAGLVCAAPVIFWQLWGFISPGLYRREKRFALPFVAVSSVLFVGGVIFAYYLVLEPMFHILLSFGGEVGESGLVLDPMVTIDKYLDMATRLVLAFGLTFEVPVVVAFLSLLGLVNWKQLVLFGRWWLLISSVVSAILTPADVLSMLFMLVPLNALYWLAVLFARLFGPPPPDPAGSVGEEGYER